MVCKITRNSASSTVLYCLCASSVVGVCKARVTHVLNSELTELWLQCFLESDEDRSFSKPAWGSLYAKFLHYKASYLVRVVRKFLAVRVTSRIKRNSPNPFVAQRPRFSSDVVSAFFSLALCPFEILSGTLAYNGHYALRHI